MAQPLSLRADLPTEQQHFESRSIFFTGKAASPERVVAGGRRVRRATVPLIDRQLGFVQSYQQNCKKNHGCKNRQCETTGHTTVREWLSRCSTETWGKYNTV